MIDRVNCNYDCNNEIYSIYLGSNFIILHQSEFKKKSFFVYDSLGTPSLSQTLAHGVEVASPS